MNARAAFCADSLMVDAHVAAMGRVADAADRADEVAAEISKAMRKSLCEGKAALVPKVNSKDREVHADAYDVLFDHIGDDAAMPLFIALLRTNCPEARALVQYASDRHSWMSADDIARVRSTGSLL